MADERIVNGATGRQEVFDDMGDGTFAHRFSVVAGGPDGMAKAYGYDANGNLATLTATGGGETWIKTLTWEADPVNGNYRLANETVWVKQ